MVQLSTRAGALPPSGIREIVNLVVDAPADSVARLEIGEPSGRTPQHILDAVAQSLTSRTGYTQSAGMRALRSALVRRLRRVHGIEVAEEQVIVSQGAVQGIAAVFAAVLRDGDEVLVPDPAWPVYDSQALLLGAVPKHYPLRAENGYLPDPAELEQLFSERTRILVLNSPSNPTGSVIDAERMRRIVEAAAAADVLVVSDEVYDEIVFDAPHAGAWGRGRDNVVCVFSFSKTYAMTGWRVGYVVVPEWMTVAAERIQETLLSCVAQPAQVAALAALEGPQDSVRLAAEEYRRRRDLAVALFEEAGVAVHRPAGAFYLMVPLHPLADSRRGALELVRLGVSVAPGSAFSADRTAFFRLSLASDEATLRRGIALIIDWVDRTDRGLVPLDRLAVAAAATEGV